MYLVRKRGKTKVNPKEFKKALDFICKEKGIDEDVVVEAMQAALATAWAILAPLAALMANGVGATIFESLL